MARAPFKHPSVFVGCPFSPKRKFEEFKRDLEKLPLEFIYADTSIKTRHVLERIRRGINLTDYSLFDITGWNANVTLELGLAEGLNKDYYIVFRPGRGPKKDAPADLKGLQRFQYKKVSSFTSDSLTYQLNMHLVKKLTHPRNIYDSLTGRDRDKKFLVAMGILAHFKNHKILRRDDLRDISRGAYLRGNAIDDIIELLKGRNLIRGRTDGTRWRQGRSLYKNIRL